MRTGTNGLKNCLRCIPMIVLCLMVFPAGVMAAAPEPTPTPAVTLGDLLADAQEMLPSPSDVIGDSGTVDSMPMIVPPAGEVREEEDEIVDSSYYPDFAEMTQEEFEAYAAENFESWQDEGIGIAPTAVTGGVYAGTISTTYLDYFTGVLLHRPGVPYVIFRSDAYNYYVFYGDGLRVNGYQFTGSGQYVRYYTQTGLVYRGTDTINISAESGFVYSNMSDAFPAVYEERTLLNEKAVLIGLGVFAGLWVLDKLFFRRRLR